FCLRPMLTLDLMAQRLVRLMLLALVWACPVQAQDEPLVVPFFSVPPFLQVDENGERAGFSVELAEMIGDEIGVEIAYADFPSFRSFVDAQASGAGQFLPGVARLPALAGSNVFSDTIVEDELRLSVRVDRVEEFANQPPLGRRIGVVPPTIGSNLEELLSQNQSVEFETVDAAVMGLLLGNVDGLLIPNPITYAVARKSLTDARLHFVGEPLQRVERVVALHESRADLLDDINAALARLEADGRLQALRLSYNVVVPRQQAKIVTVGVAHFPPHLIVREDGTYSGFIIDATRDLAARANVAIEFQEVSGAEYVQGPAASGLDLHAGLVPTPARREAMDFTFPVRQVPVELFLPANVQARDRTLATLQGKRIGLLGGSIIEVIARAASEGIDVVGYESNPAALAALLAGEVDGIMAVSGVVEELIAAQDVADQLWVVPESVLSVDTALALRFGLATLRDQFNVVIPGYLLSDRYAELTETYYGADVFWTSGRTGAALGGLALIVTGLAIALIWQMLLEQRQKLKRQAAELLRQQQHSRQLGELVANLKRSNRQLDEFAYIASHDLKEPLRGIGINANFLLREDLTGKVGDRIQRMSELAGRMEQLISDLLLFSRLHRGEADISDVIASEVIESIRGDLSEWLAERGGEVIEVGEIPSLRVDRVQLKTVLQNLIVNGIKYNRSNKKWVEIGFVAKADVNGRILTDAIFLKDNGIGIGEAYHDKIFRIFSRLNKPSEFGSAGEAGTGSGLAFVRKIVEEYDGEVDFTSTLGEGSTFYVTLPLARETL
ncbi:MAG: transporter substrate-binding domain-containing protein, partial [Pseudomonadota bacterium]